MSSNPFVDAFADLAATIDKLNEALPAVIDIVEGVALETQDARLAVAGNALRELHAATAKQIVNMELALFRHG